jgi:hypothetical protein
MSDVIVHEVRESTYRTHRMMLYVKPAQGIEVHTYKNDQLVSVRSFKVGDHAEYDSFNLKYTGPIMGITAKSVIVRKGSYQDAKTKRMKFEEFAWRNWDFDLEKVSRENWETSMYI